ncbi:MAG TPA: hypothetical protein VH518_19600 [Tepidisphaeraceae bacterium]
MVRVGCLVALVLLIGIPVTASRYLPWWGTSLVILGQAALLLFAAPKLVSYGIKRFALGLFMTKSKVLRGAQVHVHSVAPTQKPVRKPEPEPSEQGDVETSSQVPAVAEAPDHNRYVLVDFTLTPRAGSSRMTHWEPDELLLVPFDLKIAMDEDPTADERAATPSHVGLVDATGSEITDFDKISGTAHLRAAFKCPPGLSGRVKFRYYFESFGDLLLPAS